MFYLYYLISRVCTLFKSSSIGKRLPPRDSHRLIGLLEGLEMGNRGQPSHPAGASGHGHGDLILPINEDQS